jgi:hypothetical protein
MIGGVAAPPALGKGIEWSTVTAVPLMLLALSAASLGTTLWLARAARSG